MLYIVIKGDLSSACKTIKTKLLKKHSNDILIVHIAKRSIIWFINTEFDAVIFGITKNQSEIQDGMS